MIYSQTVRQSDRQTDRQTDRQYDVSLDILKAIAIFLVVYYHLGAKKYDYTLDGVKTFCAYMFLACCSMGVPIFFFVNGVLLFRKDSVSWTQWWKKIVRLLILTVLWSIILEVLIATEGRWESESFWLAVYSGKYVNALWFLKSLLVCYILFPLLFCASKNKDARGGYAIYTCVLILVAFGNNLATMLANVVKYICDGNLLFENSKTYNCITPFIPDLKGGAFYFPVAYFVLGGIIDQYRARQKETKTKKNIGVFAILFLCMFLLTIYGRMYQDVIGGYYNVAGVNYDCVLVLISVICLYALFQKINIKNFFVLRCIKAVGQNTLGIYLLHIPIGYFINGVINIPKNVFVYAILYSVAALSISLIFTVILKRIPLLRNLFKI